MSDLTELLSCVEAIWPGAFWHLAKGRVSVSEPLFGFQVLFGTDEVLAEGEGATPEDAVLAALPSKARPALTPKRTSP